MTVKRNLQDELNRMNPAADHAKLGDIVSELIASQNAVLAKLDAAAAGTVAALGTTNVATLTVTPLADRPATL